MRAEYKFCPHTTIDYLLASRRFLNLSTRPPASTNFCLPVKNGWHFEQISTLISPPLVDLVTTLAPQAQEIVHSSYVGCSPSFMFFTSVNGPVAHFSWLSSRNANIIPQRDFFCNSFFDFFKKYYSDIN